MLRVVALNAPDSKVAERRFRSRFTNAAQQKVSRRQDGDSGEDDGDGERAVALCMELVHREGCAVAEEANEILRYGADGGTFGSGGVCLSAFFFVAVYD